MDFTLVGLNLSTKLFGLRCTFMNIMYQTTHWNKHNLPLLINFLHIFGLNPWMLVSLLLYLWWHFTMQCTYIIFYIFTVAIIKIKSIKGKIQTFMMFFIRNNANFLIHFRLMNSNIIMAGPSLTVFSFKFVFHILNSLTEYLALFYLNIFFLSILLSIRTSDTSCFIWSHLT